LSGISSLTITGVSIAGLSNIELSGLFAAGSLVAFDETDYFHISVQLDGGGYNLLGAFESVGLNTSLQLDTDLDGTGDGTALGLAFQNVNFPIVSDGVLLDIRIDIFMTSGSEAVAFDSLIVTGESFTTCLACPNDTLTFSVEGTNLPQGGRIEWFYDVNPNFDPYSGDGNYIGYTPIPVSGPCSSSSLVINEIDYRPSLNNGLNPNVGEGIELLGPPGMDLSCFVLTDGDWTITFPAGSIIPPDGIFTIGNDGVHGAGFFDLDVENCGCFTDGAGGDGVLIFTDGGEYLALFDASGSFLQGLVFGAPSAANTPPLVVILQVE